MYRHLKRPDIKPRDPKKIGLALEMLIGQNMSIQKVARHFKTTDQSVGRWLTKYWFYTRPNNPVIIKLKSKI